jgi:F-type H+-transporting ATPase subunit b
MNLITPDFGLIFWQVVTLLSTLWILRKYAWNTILSSIRDREKSIENSLKAAEKAKEELEKLKLDNEVLLKEANIERDKMLKDAASVTKSMHEEAKEEAQKIGNKIISDAKLSIAREKELAIVELKDYSAKISINIAERLLKKELKSDSDQKILINKLVENFGKI